MEKFIRYIGEQFGRPTGIGGVLSTFMMNRMNQRQYKAVINNICPSQNDNILDIGFGNGYLIGKLASMYKGDYYGIEISNDMYDRAIVRNKEYIESGRMHLSVSDVGKLKYNDNYFDICYTVNTVYFWNDLTSCLNQINRVLKPGGVFLNVIYTKEWLDKLIYTNYGFAKYTLDELTEATRQTGLDVEIVDIKIGKAICIIGKKE